MKFDRETKEADYIGAAYFLQIFWKVMLKDHQSQDTFNTDENRLLFQSLLDKMFRIGKEFEGIEYRYEATGSDSFR